MTAVVPEGLRLVLTEPLSFWGGVDPLDGSIIDTHHPQRGESVQGRVLVMRRGRGSSSSASVLAECLRLGTGPAAIVLEEIDEVLAVGALAARELYGIDCPVLADGDLYRQAVGPSLGS
jgi:predicted aconitase with swiveling domain